MNKALKLASLALLTILVVVVLLVVLPLIFNGAGWLGFFGVPVIVFAVASTLIVVWARALKTNFPKG